MTCLYCIQESKEDFISYNDCILGALEKIKNHYLYIKNEFSEKERKLKNLQKRNEKLTKAVELLQQQKLQTSISALDYRSPPKRRKINIRTSRDDLSFSEEPNGRVTAVGDLTADELNMALNSQQIFDCSSVDTSISPSRNESIGETETINSPRIFRTSIEERRDMPAKRKLLEPSGNNENRKPLTPVKVVKQNDWMEKERPESRKSFLEGCGNVAGNGSFLKPLAADVIMLERKTSLSLKKPGKLKQTRLQLNVLPDTSFRGSNSTYHDDAIDASPNTSKSNRSKPMRSLLHRTNSSVNASRKANPKDPHDVTFNLREEDAQFTNPSDITHDAPSSNSIKNLQSSNVPNKKLNELLGEGSLGKITSNESKSREADSSSVMILTPATQDIIFLDDSCNQTLMESMDLLEALMKCGDQSLENLKKVERENIQQLQRTASAAPRLEGISKLNTEVKSTKLGQGSSTTTTTTQKDRGVQVKQEKTTQKPIEDDYRKTEEDEISDDDFIPLPILVKKEQLETGNAHKKRKRVNIKDKFDVDCKDCQRYIDVMGDRMSDEDIIERLNSCTRHKVVDINLTPDGFWNPFIPTFDENDPRNETLVDSRFRDRKT